VVRKTNYEDKPQEAYELFFFFLFLSSIRPGGLLWSHRWNGYTDMTWSPSSLLNQPWDQLWQGSPELFNRLRYLEMRVHIKLQIIYKEHISDELLTHLNMSDSQICMTQNSTHLTCTS
jgi:hypothetical protein